MKLLWLVCPSCGAPWPTVSGPAHVCAPKLQPATTGADPQHPEPWKASTT